MSLNLKTIIFTIFFLWFALSPFENFAQTKNNSNSQTSAKPCVKTIYGDILNFAASPLRITKKDALRLTVLSVVTAGFIYSQDSQVDNKFALANNNSDNLLILAGKKLAQIGNGYNEISPTYVIGGLTTSMLLGGIISKDRKLLDTSRLMIEAIVINELITGISKGFIGRSRPATGRGPHAFNFFKFSTKADYHSMPSGHTSITFAVMTVIAKQYEQWWIKYPAYILCTSVALQRIDARRHWTSDVLVGGAIGYWVGSTLANGYKKNSQANVINPYITPNRIGVCINF